VLTPAEHNVSMCRCVRKEKHHLDILTLKTPGEVGDQKACTSPPTTFPDHNLTLYQRQPQICTLKQGTDASLPTFDELPQQQGHPVVAGGLVSPRLKPPAQPSANILGHGRCVLKLAFQEGIGPARVSGQRSVTSIGDGIKRSMHV
jgi:hypothetical protein